MRVAEPSVDDVAQHRALSVGGAQRDRVVVTALGCDAGEVWSDVGVARGVTEVALLEQFGGRGRDDDGVEEILETAVVHAPGRGREPDHDGVRHLVDQLAPTVGRRVVGLVGDEQPRWFDRAAKHRLDAADLDWVLVAPRVARHEDAGLDPVVNHQASPSLLHELAAVGAEEDGVALGHCTPDHLGGDRGLARARWGHQQDPPLAVADVLADSVEGSDLVWAERHQAPTDLTWMSTLVVTLPSASTSTMQGLARHSVGPIEIPGVMDLIPRGTHSPQGPSHGMLSVTVLPITRTSLRRHPRRCRCQPHRRRPPRSLRQAAVRRSRQRHHLAWWLERGPPRSSSPRPSREPRPLCSRTAGRRC